MASGNLARVMLHTDANLETALSLIQTAYRQLPNSPTVADTLGWIYYQKGIYSLAVNSLQGALSIQKREPVRDVPDIHYHLGLAYEKTNQLARAREQLEEVLKIDRSYHNAAAITTELNRLKS